MHFMKRSAVILTVLSAAALLAGCSNSPAKKAAVTTTTTLEGATTTTSPPPVDTSTSTTTAAVPTSDQCTANDLQPSWPGMSNGAAGTIYYIVDLMNSSSVACVTAGYVGVSAYDPGGDLITASEIRETGGTPTLSVAPGASVNFMVGFSDVDEGGCSVTVGALHLIPPNETTEVQIATPVSSGYPSLCGKTFLVTPLQSGTVSN
jgi:hypothetical protein